VRTITRNTLLVILAVVALLLALGALPSYLRSGDPYYVVATTVPADAGPQGNDSAVDAANLSERRFPYATGAIAAAGNGTARSDPYWRGPFGLKESFTHSPFDEFDALVQGNPNATETVGEETRVYAETNGTRYRLLITQTPDEIGGTGGTNTTNTSAELAPAAMAPAATAARAEVGG
jgi:hypothetical protein